MRRFPIGLSTLGLATLSLAMLPSIAAAFPINPCTAGTKTVDPALSCSGGAGQTDSLGDVQAQYPGIDSFFDKDEDGDSDTPLPPYTDADFYLTGPEFADISYGNTTAGYFLLSEALLAGYTSPLVLVLKGGNVDPRWSMFEIDVPSLVMGAGAQAGYYYGAWSSGRQGLSHASLYVGDADNLVPEPATLALIGLGLIGAAGRLRRR